MNYPNNFLCEKLLNHGFWSPGHLYPQFILVDLIFLVGDCQQVLFKCMIWNVIAGGGVDGDLGGGGWRWRVGGDGDGGGDFWRKMGGGGGTIYCLNGNI